jgi:multiple sugar transport system permease protein
MTTRNSVRVLPVGIATLVGQYATRNNWVMAAAMLSTAPMIVLFIFLQKQFIAGVTITGLKA